MSPIRRTLVLLLLFVTTFPLRAEPPSLNWKDMGGGVYTSASGRIQRYSYRTLGGAGLAEFKLTPSIARSDKLVLEAVGNALEVLYPSEHTTRLNVAVEKHDGVNVLVLTFSTGTVTVLLGKNDDGSVHSFLVRRIR